MAKGLRLTADEIRALPDRSRESYRYAIEALNLMRTEGLSLTAAADRTGTTRRTMLKYTGRALVKSDAAEWEAKPWDRLVRLMEFPVEDGKIELAVQDSRSAAKVGRYWAAVRRFLRTGDASGVQRFRSEVVQVGFLARVRPQGDVLPVRGEYGRNTRNLNIGVNPLESGTPVWVTGPDLVASILLTGKVPEVLEAHGARTPRGPSSRCHRRHRSLRGR